MGKHRAGISLDSGDAAHRDTAHEDAAHDVVVVGAGPAGATAARQIARLGASVLLVDKATFPRDKVCGCCLNRDALATLDRLGLGALPHRLGARPLETMHLAAHTRSLRLPLPGGAAVSRAAMDMALAQAAQQAGARFLDGTTASWLTDTDRDKDTKHTPPTTGHQLLLRGRSGSRRVRARAVVVADGLGGRLLEGANGFEARTRPGARLGVGAIVRDPGLDLETGVIHMACARQGYVGMVRLEDDAVDVAAALDPRFVRESGGPGEAVAAVIGRSMSTAALASETGLASIAAAQWHGTPRLTRQRRPLAHAGVFVLGDAAGYVEPFTGEGIAWALRGGEAVADLAAAAGMSGWNEGLATAWRRRYRHLIGSSHRRCRWIAAALRRPWLLGGAMGVMKAVPWAARPLVETLAMPRRAAPGDRHCPASFSLFSFV